MEKATEISHATFTCQVSKSPPSTTMVITETGINLDVSYQEDQNRFMDTQRLIVSFERTLL